MGRFPDDFPDELLLKIIGCFESTFDEYEYRFDSEFHDNITTIQNLRLTCRRLSEISSQFLVPYVQVAPTLASLNHVDKVASHPTISRGIRRIFVDMSIRVDHYANEFNGFLYNLQNRLEGLLEQEEEDVLRMKGFKKAADGVLTVIHFLENSDGQHFRPHIDDQDYDVVLQSRRSFQRILDKEYARYRKLYKEQKQILKFGRLTRTVVAAAARGRSNIGLYILDQDVNPARVESDPYGLRRALRKHGDQEVDRHFVMRLMRVGDTETWENAADDLWRHPPQSVLYELPLAISAAGVSLTELQVDTTVPGFRWRSTILKMTPGQISGLKQVSKSLQHFCFAMRDHGWEADSDSLLTYISAVTSSHMFTTLRLYLGFVKRDFQMEPTSDPCAIGPLRLSGNWDKLKNFALSECSVHLKQLENLLRVLKPGVNITLEGIELLSGTWAEALDRFRGKVSSDSIIVDCMGAETDTMEPEEYKPIFSDFDDSDNLATEYICSVEGISNPLQRYVETPEIVGEL